MERVLKYVTRFATYVSRNKPFVLVLLLYLLLEVSTIKWGIPNATHPFNYHMDEWHQLQSIKNTYFFGSPNIEGSAHGPILQFVLSGIYLIPFMAFGIVDPFSITSSISNLSHQESLFVILRLNTILFGLLSIVFVSKLGKKFFAIPEYLTAAIFTITPIWLVLGGYFKYDIALIFWIVASLYSLLLFGERASSKRFILAGFLVGLALATKISAAPLVIVYIFSFFLFSHNLKFKTLFAGVFVLLLTFLLLGIPDIIFQNEGYSEYLHSNIITSPKDTQNFRLPYHWAVYLLLRVLPSNFGYTLFIGSVAALIYWARSSYKNRAKKITRESRNMILIVVALIVFFVSILPLQFYAGGNRALVLLPFLSIILARFLLNLSIRRRILMSLLVVGMLVQTLQSILLPIIKQEEDVRSVSSSWMLENIPEGHTIGIENIPIYQMIPDYVLKEFYSAQSDSGIKNRYSYQIVDYQTEILPKYIIITDRVLDENYKISSSKTMLTDRIDEEGFEELVKFRPNAWIYTIIGNELDVLASGMVPIPTIVIYGK